MLKKTSQRSRTRRAATAVEFAVIAGPLFFCVFACFETSRIYIISALTEDALFESLRDVMVVGATKADGLQTATEILAMAGTREANIQIIPKNKGVMQSEISDSTTSVRVSVTVPVSANTFLLSMATRNAVIHREAEIITERLASNSGTIIP